MYNLEIYEDGAWHKVCEKRGHGSCLYFAQMILAADPDSQLVIVRA